MLHYERIKQISMITGSSSKCAQILDIEGCQEFINTDKNKEANTCILELETKYVHIFLCHTHVITISSAIYIYLYVYSKISGHIELLHQLVINIVVLFMLEI